MFLTSLSGNKVYTVLSTIRWVNTDTGQSQGITLGKSLKLTCKNSSYLYPTKLQMGISSTMEPFLSLKWVGLTRYGVDSPDSELVLMYREWLDIDEFDTNLDNLAAVIDAELAKDKNINKGSLHAKTVKNVLENSVINNYKYSLMDNYGEAIIENNKVIGYKLFSLECVVVTQIYLSLLKRFRI